MNQTTNTAELNAPERTQFNIKLLSDPDTGSQFLEISASTAGFGCGFLLTETVSDIFTLRDAVNAFIEQHNLMPE